MYWYIFDVVICGNVKRTYRYSTENNRDQAAASFLKHPTHYKVSFRTEEKDEYYDQ